MFFYTVLKYCLMNVCLQLSAEYIGPGTGWNQLGLVTVSSYWSMKFQQINHRIKKKERTKETSVAMVESRSREMNPDIDPKKDVFSEMGPETSAPCEEHKIMFRVISDFFQKVHNF